MIFNYTSATIDTNINANAPSSCNCINSKYDMNLVAILLLGTLASSKTGRGNLSFKRGQDIAPLLKSIGKTAVMSLIKPYPHIAKNGLKEKMPIKNL